MLHLCALLVMLCLPLSALEPGVQLMDFECSVLPAPYRPHGLLKSVYPSFQQSLKTLSEWQVVETGLTMAAMSGQIDKAQVAALKSRLATIYSAIDGDPAFAQVASALPHCFATEQVGRGQALVSIPDRLSKNTRRIVFLHGSGGNFLYYLWQLRTRFPDAVIMCPSWEGTWRRGRMAYISAMLASVEAQHPQLTGAAPPYLMALSDGGMRGSEIYAANEPCFSGLVLLSTFPARSIAALMPVQGHVLAVHGEDDRRFSYKTLERRIQSLRRHCADSNLVGLEGGDHYIMLLRSDDCFEAIMAFMERTDAQRRLRSSAGVQP